VDPDPTGFSAIEEFWAEHRASLIGAFVGLIAFMVLLVFGLLWWRKKREKEYEYETLRAIDEANEANLPWNNYFAKFGREGSDETVIAYELDGKKAVTP